MPKAIENHHHKSVEWRQRRVDETQREAENIRELIERMEQGAGEKVGD